MVSLKDLSHWSLGPNEVSAPMAPVCRTESVVHNATMAVILEGIVLSLVIPGSLGH